MTYLQFASHILSYVILSTPHTGLPKRQPILEHETSHGHFLLHLILTSLQKKIDMCSLELFRIRAVDG